MSDGTKTTKNGCFISFCLFLCSLTALTLTAWCLVRSTADV
jgi:hypothetical protein